MASSAHLSPYEFYAVFGHSDLESSCDPTENVPSWFDRVWYIVWYSVDACVSSKWPVYLTSYLVFYPNLHIEIPTNLNIDPYQVA